MQAAATYAAQFSSNQALEMASNFHFLLYLLTNDVMKFGEAEVKELCGFVREHDREGAATWLEENPSWATFVELLKAQGEGE